MRILQVNKYLYRRGGAEGYLLDLAGLQRHRGHDVELWGMQHPENPPLPLEDTFPPEIELDPPPPGPLARVRGAGRMIWSTSSRRGLAEAVDRWRPDVAHLHNVYHQLSPSILGPLRAAGVPTVMTLHDYKLACPSYRLLADGRVCEACVGGGVHHTVLRRCQGGSLAASGLLGVESGLHRLFGTWGGVDLFVCPSRFLADVMTRAGVFPDRLRVVNHFAIPGPSPTDAGADRDGPTAVFAGRLSDEKGVDVLIEAVARAPSASAVVAGDGPARAALEAHAARVAEGRVAFTGRVDRDAVAALMASAGVVAVPSVWHENQPMTILEAFSVATPAVVTALGGSPELVVDGERGAVVPPGDPDALAAVLADVTARPRRWRAMGEAARVWAAAAFDPARHLDAVEEVYAEATAMRSSARRSSSGARPSRSR